MRRGGGAVGSPTAFSVPSLISLLRRQRSTCGAQNLLRAFACLQILTAALPAAFLPLPPAAEGHRPPPEGEAPACGRERALRRYRALFA